jgi:hypothetical protein
MSWPDGRRINLVDSTPTTPASCVFNGKIFLFWKANDGSNLIWFTVSSEDGMTFPPGQPINGRDASSDAPTPCVFSGRLFLFWKANDSSNRIFFTASDDGASWPPGRQINGRDASPAPVAACVYLDQLLLFWKANDPSNLIFFTASDNGVIWPEGRPISGSDPTYTTSSPPAACPFGDLLQLFWKANDASAVIQNCFSNGQQFFHALPVNGDDSPQGPAACVFAGQLFVFWVANNPSSAIQFAASANAEAPAWLPDQAINNTDSTPTPVSAVSFQDKCFLFWKGNDGANGIWFSAATADEAQLTFDNILFEFWTTDDDLREDSALNAVLLAPDVGREIPVSLVLGLKKQGDPLFDNWSYNTAGAMVNDTLTSEDIGAVVFRLVQGGTGAFESPDEWHVGAMRVTLTTQAQIEPTVIIGDPNMPPTPLDQNVWPRPRTKWILSNDHPVVEVATG